MNIPFVNLKRQHFYLQAALNQAFKQVLESGQVMGGEVVKTFEKSFASYIGTQYGIACGNCTDALEIIMRAMEIGPGDEVLVPANGWLSAAEVTLMLGARPVFVDTHPFYYTMDPERLEEKISHRTKAVVPIHLYGLAAPMPDITRIAQKHGLQVIEDCAQAHGATVQYKRVGGYGHAAAFSFYPTKNLGALGDGGMVVTNDVELAEKVRMIANHGQQEKNKHVCQGRNSRIDTLQAAILQIKLPFLEQWNARRRSIASIYLNSWKDLDIQLPATSAGSTHIYHLFVIQTGYRDQLARFLEGEGITTEIHYPQALPEMPLFKHLNLDTDDCPVAIGQAAKLLSIPLYPELTDQEVEYVAGRVRAGIRKVY